jgi:hypothetical protein
LQGDFSEDFVLDPNLRLTPAQNNLIDQRIVTRWLVIEEYNFSHVVQEADLEDPKRFTNLALLFMAIQPYEIVDPDAPSQYHNLREQWSYDFLVSFICVKNPGCNAGLVASASVGDLRTVVWTVIELLGKTDRESRAFVQSFRRDTPPPDDYPNDFETHVGWTYGRLLATAVLRLLRPEHQLARTLADQWVRDSTLWEEE